MGIFWRAGGDSNSRPADFEFSGSRILGQCTHDSQTEPAGTTRNNRVFHDACPCPEKSSLGGGLERCKSDLVAKALELSEAAAL
jgi:hypothetical protein